MRKVLFVICCLVLFVSCDSKTAVESQVYIGSGISVAIIDSCEYLYRDGGYNALLAHKGNCRFCVERNERVEK